MRDVRHVVKKEKWGEKRKKKVEERGKVVRKGCVCGWEGREVREKEEGRRKHGGRG